MICGYCRHFRTTVLPYRPEGDWQGDGGACLYYDWRAYHASACIMFEPHKKRDDENHDPVVSALIKNLRGELACVGYRVRENG